MEQAPPTSTTRCRGWLRSPITTPTSPPPIHDLRFTIHATSTTPYRISSPRPSGLTGSPVHAYEYDPLYRLTSASTSPADSRLSTPDSRFQYDSIGNFFSAPNGSHALYDNASRLLQWGDLEMQYDDSGRLTRKINPTTGESWSYAWNAFDQLTLVTCSPGLTPSPLEGEGGDGGESHCTVPTTVSYGYGLFGGIVWRKATTVQNQIPTVEETRYVQDGLDTIAEIDPKTGSLLKFYVHGPGIDEPLAIWSAGTTSPPHDVTTSPAWHYYHADHLGSITEMTDAQGNVAASYRYSAYGQRTVVSESLPTGLTGSLVPGFTARLWDPAAQLYNYRFRWYDPGVGRFVSEDPFSTLALVLGDDAAVQRLGASPSLWWPYPYAADNPLNHTDPYGLVNLDCYWEAAKNAAPCFASAKFPACELVCLSVIGYATVLSGGVSLAAAGVSRLLVWEACSTVCLPAAVQYLECYEKLKTHRQVCESLCKAPPPPGP